MNIVHVTANDMVQERDEEAQVVIRILAQLDKKWNNLRVKVLKSNMLNARVTIRSSEDIESGNVSERV